LHVFGQRRDLHSTYRWPNIKLAVLEDFGLYKLLPRSKRGEKLLSGHWDHNEERDVDWVAGSFMLLSRRVFDETEDSPRHILCMGRDIEWCYGIRDRGSVSATIQMRLSFVWITVAWGEQRVVICVQREVGIYARRHGRLLGVRYNLVRMSGMLSRFGYFLVRNMAGGSQGDYYRAMKRIVFFAFECTRLWP
jgi:hypothetical protein